MSPTLRITEVFHSLQGESTRVGLPTTFIRLTGCPLRCGYCDTAYAFSGGALRAVDALIDEVAGMGARHVCVTGGEPLAQPEVHALMSGLCDRGFSVSLETSGALDIAQVDPRVSRIVDLKTPGSGEVARNWLPNIGHLRPGDEVKFVICDRADYEWARMQVDHHRLATRVAAVLFSPSWGQLDGAELAQWILDDRLAVRFQMQLHKLLWGDVSGR